jgi:hypothetical protein
MEKLCSLSVVAGNDDVCPRGWCAFWEHGGAVVEGGCAIERLGTRIDDPQLARHLLELRRGLERVRDAQAGEAAGKQLTALAPPDLSGA